jgi:large subunit ribosomal protein L14
MIQMETELEVVDNTGARLAIMILAFGQNRRYAKVGDKIKIAVQQAGPGASVKKGTVTDAVVVSTKFPIRRPDGTYVRFQKNACVIINADGNPKGTRILAPVARELRDNYSKICSLAGEVL